MKMAQEPGADTLGMRGRWQLEHVRNGKVIGKRDLLNTIVNDGKDHNLGVTFAGDAQIATWFAGLIDNAGFTAISAADTHASHAGWTEVEDYDEANRVTWAEDAPSGQSITNTTTMDFTINATIAIKGFFLSSVNTKGDTGAGTLWSAAAFGSVLNAVSGDTLRLTYTLNFT